MPKVKTHKATSKRFFYTGKGKLLRRKAGQDHFNARESGRVMLRKHRDITAPRVFKTTIKKLTSRP